MVSDCGKNIENDAKQRANQEKELFFFLINKPGKFLATDKQREKA